MTGLQLKLIQLAPKDLEGTIYLVVTGHHSAKYNILACTRTYRYLPFRHIFHMTITQPVTVRSK